MMRFVPIIIASFFLSLHFSTTLYINSSFLGRFFKPDIISLLFLLGAIGNIIFFLFAPKLISKFGKRRVLFIFLILTAISTLGAAFAKTAIDAAISFIAYACFMPIIYYCLDIFLEELSIDRKTGEIRGIYLTFINLGIALGPVALIFFAKDSSFKLVYLVATLLLIPNIILAPFFFKPKFPKDHRPYHHALWLPFRTWWQAKNIRHVTFARLTLESFYALMVIYVPIYLHNHLGFDWSELGIMLTIALLPFVLIEWPAGEFADRLWGEKELMSIGFFITGVSLLVMPFLTKLFWIWVLILFTSRVGASLIESMTETYFFKKVSVEDTGLLSIFRLTRSIGFVFGAVIGILTLNIFSFEKMFFVLAILIFFGFSESLHLRDTR